MSDRPPRTVSLRVRVTPDELAQIQRLAHEESRTVSQIVWMMVREGLKAKGAVA